MRDLMAGLVSHANLLKCDDVRLKSLPHGNKVCGLFELVVLEDMNHIVMQCPGT